MNRYKVLGINDDKSHCECCGKQMLARVVWIEDAETNEIRHFGTTCAMRPAKGFHLDAEIRAAIKRHDAEQKNKMARANALYRQRGGKYDPKPGVAGTWTQRDRYLWAQCLEAA